jgi:hypothetical protein
MVLWDKHRFADFMFPFILKACACILSSFLLIHHKIYSLKKCTCA